MTNTDVLVCEAYLLKYLRISVSMLVVREDNIYWFILQISSHGA